MAFKTIYVTWLRHEGIKEAYSVKCKVGQYMSDTDCVKHVFDILLREVKAEGGHYGFTPFRLDEYGGMSTLVWREKVTEFHDKLFVGLLPHVEGQE